MKYNAKYDRWVSKEGLVYRYDKKNDKLVLCSLPKNTNGYACVNVRKPKSTLILVHRLVYETFKDKIPQGFEIDHINNIRDDNRLENLRCVTHKENMENPSSNTSRRAITRTDFGDKFKEHYGITFYENKKLYDKERKWYIRHHNVCRWEVEQ